MQNIQIKLPPPTHKLRWKNIDDEMHTTKTAGQIIRRKWYSKNNYIYVYLDSVTSSFIIIIYIFLQSLDIFEEMMAIVSIYPYFKALDDL